MISLPHSRLIFTNYSRVRVRELNSSGIQYLVNPDLLRTPVRSSISTLLLLLFSILVS